MKKMYAVAAGAAVAATSVLSVGVSVSGQHDAVVEQDVALTADASDLFAGEQLLMNGMFEVVSFLGGVQTEAGAGGFSVIDGNTSGVFDLLTSGFASPATDPGSYSLFGGALTPLFDAVNIAVQGEVPDSVGDVDWVFGGSSVQSVLDAAGGDPTTAITGLLQLAAADLLGMFVPQSIGNLFDGLAGDSAAVDLVDPGALFDAFSF